MRGKEGKTSTASRSGSSIAAVAPGMEEKPPKLLKCLRRLCRSQRHRVAARRGRRVDAGGLQDELALGQQGSFPPL